MAPTKKSIYRQPGTQHFQLVHRSVRDPLANDPDAPQQVFKPIERYNVAGKQEKGGVSLSELEHQMDKTKIRENEGEAALYGITFDDSKYDYMQHLKPVGEEGFESVLLPAPGGSSVAQGMKNQGQRSKGKGKDTGADMFKMPDELLASKDELSLQEVRERQQNIPTELQGFNPDMDPHLRQVLEALEDDEFIDDAGNEEDFFGELVETGEAYDEYDREEYEFREWGDQEEGGDDDDDDARTENGEPREQREETWEDRFRAFKEAGGRPNAPVSNGGWESGEEEDANRSEMADTVGSLSGLPDMMVKGAKKRKGKRGPSDASGMSMSSASVYRNGNLRNLDDQFDRIEREYELDDDDEWCDEDDDDISIAPSYMSSASRVSMFKGGDFEPGQPLQVTRDDFDAIMDDFLDNYEVVGNRMRESLGGTALSGPEKLKVLRSALEDGDGGLGHEENRRRILALEKLTRGPVKEDKEAIARATIEPAKEDKWDVETILSTYTNTENHPGMIRVRSSREAKERAARKAAAASAAIQEEQEQEEEEEEDSGSDTETEASKVTVARKKGESAEERRARKAAVKAERASRRAEKKSHKETFNEERKRQLAVGRKAVVGGKAADIAVGTKGVRSLR